MLKSLTSKCSGQSKGIITQVLLPTMTPQPCSYNTRNSSNLCYSISGTTHPTPSTVHGIYSKTQETLMKWAKLDMWERKVLLRQIRLRVSILTSFPSSIMMFMVTCAQGYYFKNLPCSPSTSPPPRDLSDDSQLTLTSTELQDPSPHMRARNISTSLISDHDLCMYLLFPHQIGAPGEQTLGHFFSESL